MSQKIFISYSHTDYVFANAVGRYLLRRGYRVWIDSKQLKVGMDWSEDIDEAIRSADYLLGILSADSVRRPEVIREISLALRNSPEKLLLVVIGRIHDSWFANLKNPDVQRLLKHLKKYQHIEFNGRGDITEANMQHIADFLANGHSPAERQILPENDYIAVNGTPEPILDVQSGIHFFKVQTYDLSISTGYPFALDNQWIPEVIFEDKSLWYSFEKDGFASKELVDVIKEEQLRCFYSALIHMRQLIINKSAILNTRALRACYMEDEERDAFVGLLKNGSIVVFLYGDGEMTPHVQTLPKYETDRKAIESWNRLCRDTPVYCIRENWGKSIDQHSIDFVKFCCTIADDLEDNEILSDSFGMDAVQRLQFFSVLKDIAVQGFVRTRMTGTNIYKSIKGLSRSYFYKNFIVRDEGPGSPQPTLNCLFDNGKPFHLELKRIVDIYYNSLFTNYFKCLALLPQDMPTELTFLSQLYLNHPSNNVEETELEYALSEILTYQDFLDDLEALGEEIYLRNWNLEQVLRFRQQFVWLEYISTLEATIRRSATWQVDFSELSGLVQKFVQSLRLFHIKPSDGFTFRPCFSFRINIGGSVIELVVGKDYRLYRDVVGSYRDNQNPLQVCFQIGNITDPSIKDTIFYSITLFDGYTIYSPGNIYHDKLISFLKNNNFLEII